MISVALLSTMNAYAFSYLSRSTEALLMGDVSSIQEIATNEKLDRSYVMRRLRLAYLAPDIMTAIFNGHIPPDLTINKLRRGFPLDWGQQRKHLGFTEIPQQT